MPADARVQDLLEQLFDSGAAGGEACQSCPELLLDPCAGRAMTWPAA
jgi:hypothetical protein